MRRSLVTLAALLSVLLTQVPSASGLPFDSVRARVKILSLELDEAARILKDADDDSAEVAMERARLALYRGDCDLAVATLQRPDIEDDEDEGAHLLGVALGCARSSAATVILRDDAKGVVVRFHDDEDQSLFPLIVEAAAKIRDTLAKELGTRLPEPLWIDLVRDQLALSAHSGLPEQAAKTTGTVAVAKWGRVMMISPRGASNGYPWLDTLAHEMTHLVLSQATRERAPLWLQEGVAKHEETRWRDPTPFDATPSPDAVAMHGIKTGLALALTELGPSIAMLPSAEQAAVAFAEVHSFINFWVERNGPDALPKLLTAIRDQAPGSKPEDAIQSVSGISLADWDTRWRAQLSTQPAPLPAELAPGSHFEQGPQLARHRRLGELLLERGHHHAARHQLERAHALLPSEASVRCLLSRALWGEGEQVAAAELVARADDIHYPSARWWSLNHFFMLGDAVPHARLHALGHNPFNPPIPCHEMEEGEYPADPIHRAICLAAWRMP
jgi:hypothetical protein